MMGNKPGKNQYIVSHKVLWLLINGNNKNVYTVVWDLMSSKPWCFGCSSVVLFVQPTCP